MTRAVLELVFQLVIAAVIAVVVALVDQYALGVDLPWWACAGIGLALVFGCLVVVHVIDDM